MLRLVYWYKHCLGAIKRGAARVLATFRSRKQKPLSKAHHLVKIYTANDELLPSRRVFILTSGKLALLAAVFLRISYLQVIKFRTYRLLSDKNRIMVLPQIPQRGKIMDRYRRILATNRKIIKVLLNKRRYIKNPQVGQLLIGLLCTPHIDIAAKMKNAKLDEEVLILEDINWSQLVAIEENCFKLPGVSIDHGYIRTYPAQAVTAHVVGYTGYIDSAEQKKLNMKYVSGLQTGKGGIEKYYQEYLRGEFGHKHLEVNSARTQIREIEHNPSKPGDDLALSLDLELQRQAAELIGQRVGSLALIDIESAQVLALYSSPSFDPNRFTKAMAYKEWQSMQMDPALPMMNRAIQGTYPPGSIFKIITLLAALEKGISATLKVHCDGKPFLGQHFRCWSKGGHGTLDMVEAIRCSCNTYIYHVAKLIGEKAIVNMAKSLGFGRACGIDLPGENKGLVPDREWKKSKYNSAWSLGDTLNLSIGQGYMSATALQLANMIASIASGKSSSPKLNMQIPREAALLRIQPEHLNIIRQGLFEVVNHPFGTSYANRIEDKAMIIAGKSGTSQARTGMQDHALFAAYGPVGNPRYATAVVIEHGGWGGKTAGPIARNILLAAMRQHM